MNPKYGIAVSVMALLSTVPVFAQSVSSQGSPLHVHEEVITWDGQKAYVGGFYPNGTVLLGFDSYQWRASPNQLARMSGESGGLRVGDTVYSSGLKGTVAGIFPNGAVSVRYPGNPYELVTQSPDILARTHGESKGLHVGDKVLWLSDAHAAKGTVVGIYPNGSVCVDYPDDPYGFSTQSPDELARLSSCTDVGGCLNQMHTLADASDSSHELQAKINGDLAKGNLPETGARAQQAAHTSTATQAN